MSELDNINVAIQENISKFDEKIKNKIDCNIIFLNWKKILDDDSAEFFPVKLQDTTLILFSEDPALNDYLKYNTPNLIEKINSYFGKEIVTKIKFSGRFSNKFIAKNFSAREKNSNDAEKIADVEISLTDEEIDECKKKSSVIEDEDCRRRLFECLIAKKKSDALKKLSSWHKCAVCENLCEPQENLCDFCKVHEQNKMLQAIRKLFHDTPYIKFSDVQKKICEDMPHMQKYCTLNLIDSARMDLIQQTVRRISFGDKNSPLAKFFVMLVRQLPEEKLTEKIIEKTLYEFRFDFVDQPTFKPKEFKKFSVKKE